MVDQSLNCIVGMHQLGLELDMLATPSLAFDTLNLVTNLLVLLSIVRLDCGGMCERGRGVFHYIYALVA